MTAKQTVYANADRSKAVGEGDPEAKFLLVREGCEVNDKELEAVPGAVELAGAKAKGAAKESPKPAAPKATPATSKAKKK